MFYYNVKAGSECPFAGQGAIAKSDASIPVEILFNENDSCGEAVPLENASVPCVMPDGTEKHAVFEQGENIILSHADISDKPLS